MEAGQTCRTCWTPLAPGAQACGACGTAVATGGDAPTTVGQPSPGAWQGAPPPSGPPAAAPLPPPHTVPQAHPPVGGWSPQSPPAPGPGASPGPAASPPPPPHRPRKPRSATPLLLGLVGGGALLLVGAIVAVVLLTGGGDDEDRSTVVSTPAPQVPASTPSTPSTPAPETTGETNPETGLPAPPPGPPDRDFDGRPDATDENPDQRDPAPGDAPRRPVYPGILTAADLGEPVADDGLVFTVRRVREVEAITDVDEFGGGPIRARRGGRLIRVDVLVEAVGDGPADALCSGGAALLPPRGDEIEPHERLAEISTPGNGTLCQTDAPERLEQGESATIQVPFQVPDDVDPTAIALYNADYDPDILGESYSVVRLR